MRSAAWLVDTEPPGRLPLRLDEVAHFTHMARRIAALLALGVDLDTNYRAHAGNGTS